MGGAQGARPALAQILEIGFARLDAVIHFRRAGIAACHQKIDRQSDAEIGAHGRVHRDQADLERVINVGVEGDGAVEHRLAVFVFADLQVGRVGGAFDEVAGRVDHEQPQAAAFDLAAEQKRDFVIDGRLLQRLAFERLDLTDGIADALRRLEHGRRIHQGFEFAGLRIFNALGQHRAHGLAERQIAGGGERHDAFARLRPDVQFPEGRDVVEAGIGARVGDHHQAFAHQNSAAICHIDFLFWRSSF